jgi:hypothetical protein
VDAVDRVDGWQRVAPGVLGARVVFARCYCARAHEDPTLQRLNSRPLRYPH